MLKVPLPPSTILSPHSLLQYNKLFIMNHCWSWHRYCVRCGCSSGGREERSTSGRGCRGGQTENRASAVPLLSTMNNSSFLLLQTIPDSYHCKQAIINSLVHVSLYIWASISLQNWDLGITKIALKELIPS